MPQHHAPPRPDADHGTGWARYSIAAAAVVLAVLTGYDLHQQYGVPATTAIPIVAGLYSGIYYALTHLAAALNRSTDLPE
ncbi:hypothetical protein GCM10010406_21370 [Streptomyces thermolineatus]|uniref:Uncharacterized protein n=1 Tax=Streptomyces thermolineatus TaxID=44033 RepID=A0ABP5YSB1_9ACTN